MIDETYKNSIGFNAPTKTGQFGLSRSTEIRGILDKLVSSVIMEAILDIS